jgi:hypothetical protein
VVDEALGPILDWSPASDDARERTHSLLATSIPRLESFEATFRAALKHSLDQWAMKNAGVELQEPAFTRGHRVELLRRAIAPLAVPPKVADRLAKALSLLFGIEALVVLKDIWGVDGEEAREVVLWAADRLVGSVFAEREAAIGYSV